MDLSVIVCTYNRCQLLTRHLEWLRRQRAAPDVDWEVLIVDNNCTDETPEVVRSAAVAFPAPLRYLHEPKQGLSQARNRGIAEARGRYLAFTDDDTRPDAGWVQAVWDTFERHACDGVAGRIELEWPRPRPRWMTDDLLGFLAHVDYGAEEQVLTMEESPPVGANMAFTKKVFDKVGGFDPALGRRGRRLIGGEEIELFQRFLEAGFTAIYQPKAIVYHVIEQDRLRKSYFRSLHFNEGQVRGRRYGSPKGKRVAGIPLFLFPQLVRSVLRFLATVLRHGLNRSLRKEMNVWYLLGFMLGCTKQRLNRGRAVAIW